MISRKRPSRYSVGAVRSEKSELAILDAAAYLLRKRGVEGVTVEAVARKARAGKPTIYRWWRTKSELMIEAYLRSSPVPEADPDLGNARQELRDYYANLWRFWADAKQADISRRLLCEAVTDRALSSTYFNEYIPRREAPAANILRRAIARGELPADFDLAYVLRLLTSFQMWSLMQDKPPTPAMIDRTIDMILNCPPRIAAGTA